MKETCLVWLEWPEKCFRVDDESLAHLKNLVSEGTEVVRATDEVSFLSRLPEATTAIVWNFRKEWFSLARRLRVLATPAAGRELVPADPPSGVTVHFGGFQGALMAESVAAFLLAWCRGFFAIREAPDRWPRTWMSDRCLTLAGSRALIVGYGKIGRAIGAKLEALGVEVTGVTRHAVFGKTTPETADWLILALPSTTGTDNYLDEAFIRRLPARCVVVNVGRGNAIDEKALMAALREGRLAGAYLDVIKREPTFLTLGPVSEDDTEKVPKILSEAVPHLFVMPHCSAFAPQYMKLCFDELKKDGLLQGKVTST